MKFTTKALLFSALLIFSTHTKADLYTPVNISLGVNEFNSVLNRYFEDGFDLNENLTEIPKVKGLNVQYSEIKYQAKIKPHFSIDKDTNILVNSNIELAFFEIFNVDLKYKMTRKVGSTKINVRTDIKCDYIKIYLVDGIEYSVEGIIEKNKPKIKKSNFPKNLDIRIDSKNCVGPENFEEFLPEVMLEWLYSSEGEKETLAFLNNEIVDTFWKKLKKGLEVDFFGKSIFFALLDFQKIDEKFKVNLMLRWPNSDKFYLNLSDPASLGSFTMAAKDLDIILKNWITSGCFNFSFKRSEISGVDKLFNNRFYQFFVWPDLMNFNKEASFNLKIRLCIERINSAADLSNGLNLNHQASIFIQMNFLGAGNKELPYIFLWSKASGQINLNSAENGLFLNLKNNKFDFKYMNHPKMTEWRKSKPTGGPSIGTIMGFILPELEKIKINILPNFKEVFENKKLHQNSGNLTFK